MWDKTVALNAGEIRDEVSETEETGKVPGCADVVFGGGLFLLFQKFNETGMVA